MEYKPPISKRTNEQLMEIVVTKEQWEPDAVEMAQIELTKRGVSLKTQERRRKNNIKYQQRIKSIKSRATYTSLEKILIVLIGPILFLIFQDIFLFQAGEGFKKKNKQGVLYLLLGVILWGFIAYVSVEYF